MRGPRELWVSQKGTKASGVAFLPSSCFLDVVRTQRALSKAGHAANALYGRCTTSELAVLDDELQVFYVENISWIAHGGRVCLREPL